MVWHVKFPTEVHKQFWAAESNPKGDITNFDLEMAALVLHWLALKQTMPTLKHLHVAAWSDNTPTVSWANKLKSTKSKIANHLAHALAICQCITLSSPLSTLSIVGISNDLTNIVSHSFGKGASLTTMPDFDLLSLFNSHYKLSQGQSWQLCNLSNKL